MSSEAHLSLSELNNRVKQSIRISFPENVWVVAEIGQIQENMSGHCYLDLIEKDKKTDKVIARNKANIWAYTYRMLKPFFETSTHQSFSAGIQVLVNVSVEYHELYGISLNVKNIDPAYTVGELALRKQQVINQLMEDGVFEMNRDQELPELIKRIAIISSPTAAGYEDFMNQLHSAEGVTFYTCLFQAVMQGDNAPESIIAAFDRIYEHLDLFDVVVVIRGGGASLDLSCFDNYELAYYATQFPLPIFTGIGHERDESVLDLVAHSTFKTPTAVAAHLTDTMTSKLAYIEDLEAQIIHRVKTETERASYRLNMAAQKFPMLARQTVLQHKHRLERLEEHLVQVPRQRVSSERSRVLFLEKQITKEAPMFLTGHKSKMKFLNEKARRIVLHELQQKKQKLDMLTEIAKSVDPKQVLKMGYSITTKEGKAVKDASTLKDGDQIETQLYKGSITSTVDKKKL